MKRNNVPRNREQRIHRIIMDYSVDCSVTELQCKFILDSNTGRYRDEELSEMLKRVIEKEVKSKNDLEFYKKLITIIKREGFAIISNNSKIIFFQVRGQYKQKVYYLIEYKTPKTTTFFQNIFGII